MFILKNIFIHFAKNILPKSYHYQKPKAEKFGNFMPKYVSIANAKKGCKKPEAEKVRKRL